MKLDVSKEISRMKVAIKKMIIHTKKKIKRTSIRFQGSQKC